ncbi:unnamed protein product, partial [Pleuronectes platessa]
GLNQGPACSQQSRGFAKSKNSVSRLIPQPSLSIPWSAQLRQLAELYPGPGLLRRYSAKFLLLYYYAEVADEEKWDKREKGGDHRFISPLWGYFGKSRQAQRQTVKQGDEMVLMALSLFLVLAIMAALSRVSEVRGRDS